ncbi:MAG: hypothetical protein HRU26_07790, partial [Psychroserpens sp.]|nr:hypothetical protein [Psychroserpens sp.]
STGVNVGSSVRVAAIGRNKFVAYFGTTLRVYVWDGSTLTQEGSDVTKPWTGTMRSMSIWEDNKMLVFHNSGSTRTVDIWSWNGSSSWTKDAGATIGSSFYTSTGDVKRIDENHFAITSDDAFSTSQPYYDQFFEVYEVSSSGSHTQKIKKQASGSGDSLSIEVVSDSRIISSFTTVSGTELEVYKIDLQNGVADRLTEKTINIYVQPLIIAPNVLVMIRSDEARALKIASDPVNTNNPAYNTESITV